MTHEWLLGCQPTASQLTEWVVNKLLLLAERSRRQIYEVIYVVILEAAQMRNTDNPKALLVAWTTELFIKIAIEIFCT